MPAAPNIRPATSSDLQDLLDLDPLAASQPSRRCQIEHAVAQGQCHVAAIATRLVGFVILNYSFFDNGFVPLLFVAESHRRRGIGRELMHHAQRICTTVKLFTTTNASNAPMRALLEGIGYQPSGVVENLDDNDPELVFFRRLRAD